MTDYDYPADLDVRPLSTWPGRQTPDGKRTRSPYSASTRQTVTDLRRELRALGARRPVLEVAIPPEQWRIDGRPGATARAEHPGVVLSLPETEVGPLRFACDRLDTWQANLRAIVLTMDALRAVERHGAVQAREQYRGFRALTSGTAVGWDLSEAEAVEVLRAACGNPPPPSRSPFGPGGEVRVLWREARRASHPDRHGGEREAWDRVEQAGRVLGLLDLDREATG